MAEKKEWTLMFYFASDNSLAPEIVSQLKSIKNAGFHHEVNVIAYFDPQPVGTPAHIFDVNAIYKLKHPYDNDIGFASDDPYVRDLIEDRLWGKEKDRAGYSIRQRIIDRLKQKDITYSLPPVTNDNTDEEDDEKSLRSFLDFCAFAYPAEHYMLFILGHGLVVGDDVFLLDENTAGQSVTLRELGNALAKFKTMIGEDQFELVSFHSCSMSSLEVAFQLQDQQTANYMLASQGPAFVNSWPYRQILISVFKEVAEARFKKPSEVEKMLRKIFSYVYYNSTDYLLAGYSFDLCLFDLRNIKHLTEPIKALSEALIAGLNDKKNFLVKDYIVLAHWKSQSYFQENYTDLYDFCLCLKRYCERFREATKTMDENDATKTMDEIEAACEKVRLVLRKRDSGPRDNPTDPDHPDNPFHPVESTNPIIKADFAGPDSQYSHGLSVYFPWARPTADRTIIKEYKEYSFNETTWFKFLDQYWGCEENFDNSTMRDSRKTEVRAAIDAAVKNNPAANPMKVSESDKLNELNEDIASLMFNIEGALSVNSTLSGEKPNPQSSTGDGCTCGSIKNYLRDTRARRVRGKEATKISPYPIKKWYSNDQQTNETNETIEDI